MELLQINRDKHMILFHDTMQGRRQRASMLELNRMVERYQEECGKVYTLEA
jgi:hypothetical protein